MTSAAIWTKHRKLARHLATKHHIPGSEPQDVQQEALIGLWIAARDYIPGKGTTFRTFAETVIRRHLADCVKAALRHKHTPLTHSARVHVDPDDGPASIVELLPHLHQVSDRVEERDDVRRLLQAIDAVLDERERYCVLGVASGLSYWQMGHPKAVDNTLTRARAKLREAA